MISMRTGMIPTTTDMSNETPIGPSTPELSYYVLRLKLLSVRLLYFFKFKKSRLKHLLKVLLLRLKGFYLLRQLLHRIARLERKGQSKFRTKGTL